MSHLRRSQKESLFDWSERRVAPSTPKTGQQPIRHISWPEGSDAEDSVAIALVQFAPHERSPSENVDYLVKVLTELRDTTVVFPEFFLSSYTQPDVHIQDRQATAWVLKPLQDLCYRNSLSVVGSLPIRMAGRQVNNVVMIDRGTTRFSNSSKSHLFGSEDDKFEPGRSYGRLSLHSTSVVIQICMDIVDPMPSREAVGRGARAILGPAAVSVDYLRSIHKARALENQALSVFCNRVGFDVDGIRYLGRSGIFFPDGRSISASGSDAEVLVAHVDMRHVVGYKKRFGFVE